MSVEHGSQKEKQVRLGHGTKVSKLKLARKSF